MCTFFPSISRAVFFHSFFSRKFVRHQHSILPFNWNVLDIIRFAFAAFSLKWIWTDFFFSLSHSFPYLISYRCHSHFSYVILIFRFFFVRRTESFQCNFVAVIVVAADRIVWNKRSSECRTKRRRKKIKDCTHTQKVSKGGKSFFFRHVFSSFFILRWYFYSFWGKVSGRWYVNFSMCCRCSNRTIDTIEHTKLYL